MLAQKNLHVHRVIRRVVSPKLAPFQRSLFAPVEHTRASITASPARRGEVRRSTENHHVATLHVERHDMHITTNGSQPCKSRRLRGCRAHAKSAASSLSSTITVRRERRNRRSDVRAHDHLLAAIDALAPRANTRSIKFAEQLRS